MASCPDGKPGWWAGFNACTVPGQLDDTTGPPPAEGMRIAFVLDRAEVPIGGSVGGSLTVTNGTDSRIAFFLGTNGGTLTATVLGSGGGGAVLTTDVSTLEPISLAPHDSVVRRVAVPTVTCGDTYGDDDPPLPAGRYDVTAGFFFEGAHVVPPSSPSPEQAPSATEEPTPAAGPADDQPSPEPWEPSPEPSASDVSAVRPSGSWFVRAAFTVR